MLHWQDVSLEVPPASVLQGAAATSSARGLPLRTRRCHPGAFWSQSLHVKPPREPTPSETVAPYQSLDLGVTGCGLHF